MPGLGDHVLDPVADPAQLGEVEPVVRVRAGEPAAQQIWAQAIDALADALAAVTILVDPGRFVLGGGLSLAGPTLTEPLRAALDARLTFRPAPPIAVSGLGDRAGVLGAALRAWV